MEHKYSPLLYGENVRQLRYKNDFERLILKDKDGQECIYVRLASMMQNNKLISLLRAEQDYGFGEFYQTVDCGSAEVLAIVEEDQWEEVFFAYQQLCERLMRMRLSEKEMLL